jgi:hypothetical protein
MCNIVGPWPLSGRPSPVICTGPPPPSRWHCVYPYNKTVISGLIKEGHSGWHISVVRVGPALGRDVCARLFVLYPYCGVYVSYLG